MHIEPGDTVLEPSAGHGALAFAASHYTDLKKIRCYDTDSLAIAKLAECGFDAYEANFLDVLPLSILLKFDHVLMNPPFAKGQDLSHVTHALDFVRPGGHLVAIMSAGIQFKNTSKAHKAFGDMLIRLGATITSLPETAFRGSGTDVRTVLVCVTMPLGHS